MKSALFLRTCLWRVWTNYRLKVKLTPSSVEKFLKKDLSGLREATKSVGQDTLRFEEVMSQHFHIISCDLSELAINEDQLMDLVTEKQAVLKAVAKKM